MTFKPWTFFAVAIASWMNLQQQEVIDNLRGENRILRVECLVGNHPARCPRRSTP